MKIRAVDFIKKSQFDDLDVQKENENIEDETNEDLDVPQEGRTKLEADYVTNDLSYGDRLRIHDPKTRKLYDVIQMPDGNIAIQALELRIHYGEMKKYRSWEEASNVLPTDYSIENAINFKKKDNKP